MSNPKEYKKLKFDIPISTIIMTVLSLFFGGIAYYFEIYERFNLIVNAIIIISLLLVISIILLIYLLIKYLKVLKDHNALIDEHNHVKSNRNGLERMVKNKEKEIGEYTSKLRQSQGQTLLLLEMRKKEIEFNPEILDQSIGLTKNIEVKENA